MSERSKFFDQYRIRGTVILFLVAFSSRLFFMPKGGLITRIFLGSQLGRMVFALPHFLGSLIDGIVVAGVVLLWSRVVDEGWFTPATRRVIFTVAIIVFIFLADLIIDQFYTIPAPWLS